MQNKFIQNNIVPFWQKWLPAMIPIAIAICFLCIFVSPALAQAPIPVSITKSVNNNNPITGEEFNYTITYGCAATVGDCNDIIITDVLPAGMQYVNHAVNPSHVNNVVINGNTLRFEFIDPLVNGSSGDIIITAVFPPGTTPDQVATTNQAEVDGSNGTPKLSNSVVVTSSATPDWSISKNLQTNPASLDADVTYRIRLDKGSINGNLNITNLVVTDTLPAGSVFVSATNGGTYNASSHTVTWDIANATGRVNRYITIQYPSTTFNDGDTVTNNVRIDGQYIGRPDTELIGTGVVSHPVVLFTPIPNGPLNKSVSEAMPYVGDIIDYRLQARNRGNVALDNHIIEDMIPDGTTLISVKPGRANGSPITVTLYYSTTSLSNWTQWPNASNPFMNHSNPTLYVSNLGLSAGEYVTGIRWDLGTTLPGFIANVNRRPRLNVKVDATYRDGSPIINGETIRNCASVTADYNASQAVNRQSCKNIAVIVLPVAAHPRIQKEVTTSSPYYPNDIIGYRLKVDNQSNARDDMVNPIVMDLLPAEVEYVANSFAFTGTVGVPTPNFEAIDNYNNTGQTLLRWSWTGSAAHTFLPNSGINIIDFDTRIKQGTPAGSLDNRSYVASNDGATTCAIVDTLDLDGDGDNTDLFCESVLSTVTLDPLANMKSEKMVRGQLDTDYNKVPDYGQTVPGGAIDYRIIVTNTGNVVMENLVMIDILPFMGDTGVQNTTSRYSKWSPLLTAPIHAPTGVTVYYSTEEDPCRNEINPTPIPTGCTAPNWSAVPPTDMLTVRSFKLDFGALVMNPLDVVVFDFTMIAPANAPTAGTVDTLDGAVDQRLAWNSFAYVADRMDTGTTLFGEPNKVGIIVQPIQPASLGDYVWVDTNGDGVQNDGATGMNGVPVSLYQPGADGLPNTADDVFVRSTVTIDDINGNPGYYVFGYIPAGDYFVKFAPPIGYGVTTANQGDDALDSDVDQATNSTSVINLSIGEEDYSWDLGLVQLTTAVLGNYVWFDDNGDGIQNESTSKGVNGVTVTLFQGGNPVDTTTTVDDVNGNPGYYLFDGLTPGIPYSVTFTLPPTAVNFTSTGMGITSSDSDADPVTGASGNVTLSAGEYNSTLDAGLIPKTGTLSLGNVVWIEKYGDGVYDPFAGETGINGVKVNLYLDDNGNGVPDLNEFRATTNTSTQSGENGRYLFENLSAANYIVQIDPANFNGGVLTNYNSTIGNPDPDNDTNNDDNGGIVGANGSLSLPITLSENGEPTNDGDTDNNSNLTVDFGFLTSDPVSLGNRVWLDSDNNGSINSESGINGVVLNLYLDATMDGIPDGTMLATTTTANGGYYLFDGLASGSYLVEVDKGNFISSSALYGLSSSTITINDPNSTTDNNDDNGLAPSNGDDLALVGIWSDTITLAVDTEPTSESDVDSVGGSGNQDDDNTNLTLDFGFFDSVSIGNQVWGDINNNGIMDNTEFGISNVTLLLYADGAIPGTTTPVMMTVTDANGRYLFNNIPPGTYFVAVDSSSLSGFTASSSGGNHNPDGSGDDDSANGDDGVPNGNGYVVSKPFTTAPLSQGDTGDNNDPSNFPDSSAYMTIDFGFTNSPTAVSLQSITIASNSIISPIIIVTLLLTLVGGIALRRRTR